MARQRATILLAATLTVAAGAAATAETTIEIESRTLRQPAELLDGPAGDPTVTISARLSLPEGDARVPAMVIVHGSSGIGKRGRAYQALLNDMGVATLRTDSFGPRGVRSTVGNQSAVTTFSMVADAYAALAFLAAHPRIDSARIGIMGFSKGGSTAHFAAFEPIRAAAGVGALRFAVHIPFYRGCLWDVEMALTGAPVRELLGAEDNYTGVAACVAYARRQKRSGADYEAIVYPHAHHGFDGTGRPSLCQSCNSYVTCALRLDARGTITDKRSGTRLTLENYGKVLRPCIKRGATVGGNPTTARAARRFVEDYLTELFGLPIR